MLRAQRSVLVVALGTALAGCPPAPPPPPLTGLCGDGVVNAGEECDTGRTLGNGDGAGQCRRPCTAPFCGDGILDNQVTPANLIAEACDDGNVLPGDNCSPACQDEGLFPPYALIGGFVRNREYRDVDVQSGVTVRIANATCPPEDPAGLCESQPSIGTGLWSIDEVPTNSAVVLETEYPETFNAGAGEQPVPATFRTRVKQYTGVEPVAQNMDAFLLRYNSVAQLAVDCGVYTTLTNALASTDWSTYVAFFGQVKDPQGNGAAGIAKGLLYARLGNEVNDAATRGDPDYFCWLEDDPASPGKLRGSNDQNSTNGYFMIFKARNDVDQTGTGNAYIGVAANPNLTVTEVSLPVEAGNIGVVTLTSQPAPIVQLRSFANDVYPLFYQQLGCANCHYNGGVGYEGPNQIDFTGNPAQVYDKLMASGGNCLNNPGEYPVCLNNPAYSLVLLKPLLGYAEEHGINPVAWHANATYQDELDPYYVIIKEWIEQGAVNDYNGGVVPLDQPYLDVVMTAFQQRSCTACHAYQSPSGDLPLDGCIPGFDYAGVGVDPNVPQDCVYYHLKNQGVLDDPYLYGYRVNPNQPEQSMLLRNPYCGPGGAAICDPVETHPLQIWPDRDIDPTYQLILAWIQAGANNNYAP